MEAVFLKLLNMSISATWLVLAVLVLRLFLKKAPRYIHVFLWALVGIRLVLPFSIESIFSLIPSIETIPPEITMSRNPAIHTGISFVNSAVNPIIAASFTPNPATSANPLQILMAVGWNIWLLGMVCMLLYSAVSYIRLRWLVRINLQTGKNVYLCDRVTNPFILGFFRPRIYLPSGMDEAQQQYVLAHEHAHLKRRDHWWKPLGFFLLSIHWFNPLLWAGYILLCRDIEFACDEKVIQHMDNRDKKGYSEALVACSMQRRAVMACPLAFGEVGVKARIKSVLNYKKPAFWIILICILLCAALAIGFLTDPVTPEPAIIPNGVSVYTYLGSEDVLPPTLTLNSNDHTFSFMFSAVSSYWPRGSYIIEGDKLTAKTDDGLYTFVFYRHSAGWTFSTTKYGFSYPEIKTSPIPNGAVFALETQTSINNSIPTLTVRYNGQELLAWNRLYYWRQIQPDGTILSTKADGPEPTTCIGDIPKFSLIPSVMSAVNPYQATFTFSEEPRSISVHRYDCKALKTTPVAHSYSGGLLEMSAGDYLYVIDAHFESDAYKGSVQYAFTTAFPSLDEAIPIDPTANPHG